MKRMTILALLISSSALAVPHKIGESIQQRYPGIVEFSQLEGKYGSGMVVEYLPFEGVLTELSDFKILGKTSLGLTTIYQVSSSKDGTQGSILVKSSSSKKYLTDIELKLTSQNQEDGPTLFILGIIPTQFITRCFTPRDTMGKSMRTTWLDEYLNNKIIADFKESTLNQNGVSTISIFGKTGNVYTLDFKLHIASTPGPKKWIMACTIKDPMKLEFYK